MAIKIIDVDNNDYRLSPAEKDEAIKDFLNEINILHTLKDARAKNINTIHEAFPFNSALWIVSDYCPGGSVHTLMKASKPGPGLAERYIIAISRELAIALKHVHELNIIHRDVKAGNILITEDGQLQLCDFGVSGVLETSAGKRSTIIGTPFWMAPEMHTDSAMPQGYGTEVDCWAFGCTVYELATGLPPNARIPPNRLGYFLHEAPRLEGHHFSDALKGFVSFCLKERPEDRPTADAILNHPYIRDSAGRYPTMMLKELMEDFARWEASGGQRASLFNPYGAQGPSPLDAYDQDDEWNFSTTAEFENRFYAQQGLTVTPSAAVNDSNPKSRQGSTPGLFDRASDASAAIRGGSAMAGIFNPDANPYQYTNGDESSDLPLRKFSADHAANRLTMIDLDLATTVEPLSVDLADVPTIRGKKNNPIYDDDDEEEQPENHTIYFEEATMGNKRDTIAWTFPTAMTVPAKPPARPLTQDWTMDGAFTEANLESKSADESLLSAPTPKASQVASFRPQLTHSMTEPLGSFGDFMHPFEPIPPRLSHSPDRYSSLLDLDAALIPRPSTAASTATDFTDVTTGDPWDLDPDTDTEIKAARNRQSYHMYTHSEPAYGQHGYDHDRGGSMSSDDYDRGRALSVKASADSLRTAMDEDDGMPTVKRGFWGHSANNQPQARTQYADRIQDPHQPLFSAPVGGGFNITNWPSYDSDTNGTGAMEREALTLHTYKLDDSSNASFPNGSDGLSGSTLASRHNVRGRTGLALRGGERATVEGFPEPRGPDPAALEEDASVEQVAMELERLLGDFSTALRISAQLLGSGERRGSIEEGRVL